MSNSITKQLHRRKILVQKMNEMSAEITAIDADIFPRIEMLAAALDGGAARQSSIKRLHRERDSVPGPLQLLAQIEQSQPKPRIGPLVAELENILRGASHSMRTGEILAALQERGIQVNGKLPMNNLAAHLSHHKDKFARDSEGWKLRQVGLEDKKTNAHSLVQ